MLRDRLGTSAWLNLAPHNFTQTKYTRFMKMPGTPVKQMNSLFRQGEQDFKLSSESWKHNRYWRDV